MAERTRRPQKVRVPVVLPDDTAPARWLANIRVSGFTVMMFGLLVLAVIILAPSLKLLIEQHNQIVNLQKSVAEQKNQVKDLKSQVARWDDPAYIEAQARNRLLFVSPGEYTYLVTPVTAGGTTTATTSISKKIQHTQVDWVQSLTDSVLQAGLSTATKTKLASNGEIP
jgi:cell division protein FtsB